MVNHKCKNVNNGNETRSTLRENKDNMEVKMMTLQIKYAMSCEIMFFLCAFKKGTDLPAHLSRRISGLVNRSMENITTLIIND